MAINDVYSVDFSQLWMAGGEPMHNVFFFRAKDANGTAQKLHGAFGDPAGIMGAINNLQTVQVKNSNIKVINLFSLTDFYDAPVSGTGFSAVATLPAQDTVSFTLKLNTRGIKPGRKSISGLPSAWQEAGRFSGVDPVANIAAMAAILSEDITDPDETAVFEPVVVKRIKTLVAAVGDKPAHYKYTLPDNVGDLDYGKVVAALANFHVGSMDTRDNGR